MPIIAFSHSFLESRSARIASVRKGGKTARVLLEQIPVGLQKVSVTQFMRADCIKYLPRFLGLYLYAIYILDCSL